MLVTAKQEVVPHAEQDAHVGFEDEAFEKLFSLVEAGAP